MTDDRPWIGRPSTSDHRDLVVDAPVDVVPVVVPQMASPDEPSKIGVTQAEVVQLLPAPRSARQHQQLLAGNSVESIHSPTLPPHHPPSHPTITNLWTTTLGTGQPDFAGVSG